ncbi:MAG: hypothetical protein IKH13_00970 [Clostridia bacterium]|nr:hypothetical protein [Clostridia bacterium]
MGRIDCLNDYLKMIEINKCNSEITPLRKKANLFISQKQTLDLFLERNAITKAQYDKSLRDLIEKMGVKELLKAGELDG